MAEVSSELIYETLKKIQSDVSRIDRKVDEVKAELISVRGHMVAMQQDIHNIYNILDDHSARLDRIERRLELTEPTR